MNEFNLALMPPYTRWTRLKRSPYNRLVQDDIKSTYYVAEGKLADVVMWWFCRCEYTMGRKLNWGRTCWLAIKFSSLKTLHTHKLAWDCFRLPISRCVRLR